MSAPDQKMSRMQLTAMVVGGMVGAGIFSLPRTFANATGPIGAVIAWIIAGTGMYMLARVFQALAERKPDIDAGVYAYARRASATTRVSCRPSATGSPAALATWRIGC